MNKERLYKIHRAFDFLATGGMGAEDTAFRDIVLRKPEEQRGKENLKETPQAKK